MTAFIVPALFAVILWWLSTAGVLAINSLPAWTHRWSVVLGAVVALVALWEIAQLSDITTPSAAYLSFVFSIVVWAWHEVSFLTGAVTGPVTSACPPSAKGWRRFFLATAAVLYHELALVATLALIAVLTLNGSNHVALGTFAVLWVMRLSAKFNLFLGVRNASDEFIPFHMRYLASYFGQARKNALMLVSILMSALVLTLLVGLAFQARHDPFVLAGTLLVTSLLALALLEHVFLAVPMHDAKLWRWAVTSSSGQTTDAAQQRANGA